jgi:hypothetical protein
MVTTLFAKVVGNWRSGDEAGPMATAPVVVNSEPWQGHT